MQLPCHLKLVIAASILLATVAAPAQSRPAKELSTAPSEREVVFPLSRAAPLETAKYSLDTLSKTYSAFEHEPFATAGVNHFVLPFHYANLTDDGQPDESLAFSFLLSHSLAWMPGTYCARHCYFVFKRSRKHSRQLQRVYDPRLISYLLKDWRATHALGGAIVRQTGGYSGWLQIYNRSGTMVLEKEYQRPRDYFQLLGDMCVDAMRFFGHEPSAELVEHLHRKRCNHRQSLIDLGKAAFAKERSDHEFGLYRQILQRDPDFADVRYLWAHQAYWRGSFGHPKQETAWKSLSRLLSGGALNAQRQANPAARNRKKQFAERRQRQLALSLTGYLTRGALVEFDPEESADLGAPKRYAQWLDEGETLTGPHSPDILRRRVKMAHRSGRVPPELLKRATAVAAKFPNSHWLLYNLGKSYYEGSTGQADYDMAASIFLTAMRDNFMTSTGDYSSPWRTAKAVSHLGDWGAAYSLIRDLTDRESKAGRTRAYRTAPNYHLMGEFLLDMGQHAQAVKAFQTAFGAYGEDDSSRQDVLLLGGIAAALARRCDILEQILADHKEELDKSGTAFLLEAYRDTAAGREVDIRAVWKRCKQLSWWWKRRGLIYCCQAWLLRGESKAFRYKINEHVLWDPHWRPAWIVFDGYDRLDPSPASASFYEAIDWLHGDDPWVVQAVADYRKRIKEPQVADGDKLRELLDTLEVRLEKLRADHDARRMAVYEALERMPAGTFAATVSSLLKQGELDDAQELTGRLRKLADISEHYKFRGHCNHLWHLVRQARRKAHVTTSGKKPAQAQ